MGLQSSDPFRRANPVRRVHPTASPGAMLISLRLRFTVTLLGRCRLTIVERMAIRGKPGIPDQTVRRGHLGTMQRITFLTARMEGEMGLRVAGEAMEEKADRG